MKRQILFVIPSMRSGGAEKSLLTLLTVFDYEKYDVDLLCFRHDGLFFDKLPSEVNVLPDSKRYEMFDGDAKLAFKYFIKNGMFFSAVDRWKYSRLGSMDDVKKANELRWKYLKKQLPKIKKEYDCAVGYLEGNANRFVVETVRAKRKICYVHSVIDKLDIDKESFGKTFVEADRVVTVSEECRNNLLKNYPELEKKFFVLENITSKKLLEKESKTADVYPQKSGEIIINTVGRFSEPKNISLAVDACAELVRRGNKIKWYHIGEGPLRPEIEKRISENGLENTFVLLGERSNPYPYIGQCDIYVQPSLYEGKSIAIDEAKCLSRPIVVTDFTTVHDQITDGTDGIICNMDKGDMADKIEILIKNRDLRERLTENLRHEKTGNEEEILKFYKLIDG